MRQPDWPRLVLDPDWLQRLERQAARRFSDAATAEEAVTFVLDRLAADDWQRCRRFSGRSRPHTFLFSVAGHLLEEFARSRYGRIRPPAWLQRQGELWVELWRRICLERALVPQVVERLSAGGRHDPSLLNRIVQTIKARLPWCGAADMPIPAEYVAADGSVVDRLEQTPGATLEDALDSEQREETLATLAALLSDESNTLRQIPGAALARSRELLDLSAEEILILRLHFQEGLALTAVAAALGVPRHQPGRQMKRALAKIRAALTAAGIDLAAALDTLDIDS